MNVEKKSDLAMKNISSATNVSTSVSNPIQTTRFLKNNMAHHS